MRNKGKQQEKRERDWTHPVGSSDSFCNAHFSQECLKFVDTVEVENGLGVK